MNSVGLEDPPKHPNYPIDMMDKLWDDYHEVRDTNRAEIFEFKDGETKESKVILKSVDHKALVSDNETMKI